MNEWAIAYTIIMIMIMIIVIMLYSHTTHTGDITNKQDTWTEKHFFFVWNWITLNNEYYYFTLFIYILNNKLIFKTLLI